LSSPISQLIENIALRPEHALVLLCSRTVVSEAESHRVEELLREDLDWEYVFRFARRHSVLPLLYLQLQKFATLVPSAQLQRLKTHYQENTARNILLTDELCRLISVLESAGIEAIPYKGPALAVYAYGDLSYRRFVDLDIMVRKADVLRAKEILVARGYACDQNWTIAQESVLLRTQHNLPLRREAGRMIVELHWEVASDLFASSLQAEQLWERLETMKLSNFTVKTMSREDLLLSLCVHGSRHLWERLAWICDIAELLRAHPDLDWSTLELRAAVMGNTRMLSLGLSLAHTFYNGPLPEEVSLKLTADQALTPLINEVRTRLFSGTEHLPVTANESFRYNMQVREGWRSKLRYFRLIFRPTDGDVATISLPAGLSFAYYLVRPLRLFRSDRERRTMADKGRHA
jgi:hypothetical protein